jgi:hypothetical protein
VLRHIDRTWNRPQISNLRRPIHLPLRRNPPGGNALPD